MPALGLQHALILTRRPKADFVWENHTGLWPVSGTAGDPYRHKGRRVFLLLPLSPQPWCSDRDPGTGHGPCRVGAIGALSATAPARRHSQIA
jgi:hypothetical protein